jgi:hypothetical protein
MDKNNLFFLRLNLVDKNCKLILKIIDKRRKMILIA